MTKFEPQVHPIRPDFMSDIGGPGGVNPLCPRSRALAGSVNTYGWVPRITWASADFPSRS